MTAADNPADIVAKIKQTDPSNLREAFLAELCHHDPELMKKVAQETHGWLHQDDPSLPPIQTLKPLQPGDRLGRYQIERGVGSGGMGRVYLATRSDDVRYQVALKVVGTNDPKVVRRFEKERRILARFHHPHIAHIMDAGLTAQGLPWLAMEYVDGAPLDQYCNEQRLSLRERLVIFRKICEAVRYAHGNMVIHRDLKPSNIMVTHAGEPKLLDFGIATMLNPDTAVQHTVTRFHEQVMTPSYASPEQIRGEELGAATDVYSLGIILYELLAGVKPYEIKSHNFNEWVEVVCQREPARLGKALTTATQTTRPDPTGKTLDLDRIAFQRHTEINTLRRHLRGDLETIVGKALRKEPGERYPSAEALAGDIAAYLDGMPISARPPTLSYFTAKFCRRNWLPVTLTVVFMLTLAGFGLLNYRLRLISEQERDAANAVTHFLETIFALSGPQKARGEKLTAVELIDRASLELKDTLLDEPEIRARLMSMIAEVYQDLGAWEKALPLSQEQLAVARKANDPETLIDALLQCANIYEEIGRYVEAEQFDQEALQVLERHRPDDHYRRWRILMEMGVTVRSQGQLDRAQPLFEESLRVMRLQDSIDDADFSTTLNELAYLYHDLTRYTDAEKLYKESLALDRRVLGNDHPDTSTSLNNIAVLMLDMGRLADGWTYIEESKKIAEAVLGVEHPLTGGVYRNCARILSAQGKHREAYDYFTKALPTYERDYDELHIFRLRLELLILAERRLLNGDDVEADLRQLFRRAEKRYEDTHILITNILYQLGETALAKGNNDEALALFDSALDRHRLNRDFNNALSGTYMIGKIRALIAQGKHSEAKSLAAQAREQIYKKTPDHWQLLYLDVLSLQCDQDAGRPDNQRAGTLRDLATRLSTVTGPDAPPTQLANRLADQNGAAR